MKLTWLSLNVLDAVYSGLNVKQPECIIRGSDIELLLDLHKAEKVRDIGFEESPRTVIAIQYVARNFIVHIC
jgi:hypothetical protein